MTPPGSLRLVPGTSDDLDLVLACESDPDVRPWITPGSRDKHEQLLGDPDCELLMIVDDTETVGFVILRGLTSPHGSIELRRIALLRRGAGLGSAAMDAVANHAFDTLGAHRLWVDVVEDHVRARRAYERQGFRVEGVLRKAFRSGEDYTSLLLMAQLATERAASTAQGRQTHD